MTKDTLARSTESGTAVPLGARRSSTLGYTRFRALAPIRNPEPRGEQASPMAREAVMRAVYGVDSSKFSSWDAFCIWCLLAGRGSDVVIWKTGGEVLASEGDADLSAHAEVTRYLDRLLGVSYPGANSWPLPMVVAAQVEECWLTGLRIQPRGREPDGLPMIGLRSSEPLYFDVRSAIVVQARYTLQCIESG